MNTPNNLEWLDDVLTALVDEWAEFMLHGKSPDGAVAIAKAKQTIATKLAEAYKQGGVDELKHLWSDDVIYWSPNGTSSEFDKSMTLQDRIATLTNDKELEQ